MGFWGVAQAESQRENVADDFLKRTGYETYLPKTAVRIGGRERIEPLFRGYIFVRIEDRWYTIRWTIGVLRLLMWDDMPAALPDREIEKLRKREGPNGLVKLPKPRGIRRGDPMRVKAGSFAGKLALWDGQDGAARVRVLIEALGRRVRVSLPKGDVEPLTMDHAALQQVA